MGRADLVIINDGEARMLSEDETWSVPCTHWRRKRKPPPSSSNEASTVSWPCTTVSSWRCLLFQHRMSLTQRVGDTFAGALLPVCRAERATSTMSCYNGLMVATVMASFTLEAFGTEALRGLELKGDFDHSHGNLPSHAWPLNHSSSNRGTWTFFGGLAGTQIAEGHRFQASLFRPVQFLSSRHDHLASSLETFRFFWCHHAALFLRERSHDVAVFAAASAACSSQRTGGFGRGKRDEGDQCLTSLQEIA